MNTNDTELMQFPCEYSAKIIFKANDEDEAQVFMLLKQHLGELTEGALKQRPSRDGKYLSLTVRFTADSKAQLDALYQALSDSPHVVMAL